ncbi:MAG: class I SAM-dependent methyltransferase [Woeseiaceae bacterium]|nr:class I SAM-dependent methyltransferase [Woeseiaceae bacterium]
MDELELLIDLHKDDARQGPGGDRETRLSIELSGLSGRSGLSIADIGCGTGASTLVLARELDAHITAVDFVPGFLSRLEAAASRAGVTDRIATLEASMDALPFERAQFDAIWSEGAIYNMGFAAGVEAWREYLKPDGILAVSELTWLTGHRPPELQTHWKTEYPEVNTAAGKLAVLEGLGFAPIGYFVLPEHCWLDNYYRPVRERFAAFLERHEHSEAARQLIAAEELEISLYERYKEFFGYGYYVARKVGP